MVLMQCVVRCAVTRYVVYINTIKCDHLRTRT